MIPDVCRTNKCDILCIQETPRGLNSNRPNVAGMTLITEQPDDHHRSAIFLRNDLCCEAERLSLAENIEVLTIELVNIAITSVYKPSATDFEFFEFDPVVFEAATNQLVIGDFNSHSMLWVFLRPIKMDIE